MNWDALGAVAELLGAVAVLATLVYLALQIRQNSQNTRAQTYNDMLMRQHGFTSQIYSNHDLCRIWADGTQGDELEPVDAVRFTFLWLDAMYHFEDCYVQFKNGIVEEGVWRRQAALLSGSLGQPGFLAWWEGAKPYFLPEFIEVVNKIEPLEPLVRDPETGEWGRPSGARLNPA